MSNNLTNIDNIIVALKSKCKEVIRIKKYDGITVECAVPAKNNCDVGVSEVSDICKSLKLLPVGIQRNGNKSNLFLLQFPELVPSHTEKEIEKLYKGLFKWLLDNIKTNDVTITKQLVTNDTDKVIKQAMMMFYRAHMNPYKTKLDDFLNNYDNRLYVEHLLKVYLDEYFK